MYIYINVYLYICIHICHPPIEIFIVRNDLILLRKLKSPKICRVNWQAGEPVESEGLRAMRIDNCGYAMKAGKHQN